MMTKTYTSFPISFQFELGKQTEQEELKTLTVAKQKIQSELESYKKRILKADEEFRIVTNEINQFQEI